MANASKTPATISIAELARMAQEASHAAGEEARKAGVKVAAIDVPPKSDSTVQEPGKKRA